MKKKIILLIVVCLSGLFPIFAENSPQSKALLEEALRLYSERQYVRALDLFKQVQRADPSNATAQEYIQSSEKRILEWESQGAGESDKKQDATWDSLLGKKKSSPDSASNANDIIAARKSLVEKMKNRSMNTDNIVKVQETKNGVDIILYHDQLFVPGLQTLRDESLPVLENVAQLIRQKGDRQITITSQAHTDSQDPYMLYPAVSADGTDSFGMSKGNAPAMFQDIEAVRSMILFTHLAQRSMGRSLEAK